MAFGNTDEAARAQREQQERQDSQFKESTKFELMTIPGEVVIGRFVGGADEPFIWNAHGFSKNDGRFDSERCMAPDFCPACKQADRRVFNAATGKHEKETRVKAASPRAAMTFFSLREVLLIPATKQDGSAYVKRVPLRRNAQNQHIEFNKDTGKTFLAGNGTGIDSRYTQYQRDIEGLVIWSGSLHPRAANVDQILQLEQRLSQRCLCGKNVQAGVLTEAARVEVRAYTCTECGKPVAYDSASKNSVTCAHCRTINNPPDADLRCTANCGNPRRASLTDCYVRITQNGAGDQKAYTVENMPFQPPAPAHAALMYPEGKPNLFDMGKLYPRNLAALKRAMTARGIILDGSNPSEQGPGPQGGNQGGPPQGMPEGGLPPIGGGPGTIW